MITRRLLFTTPLAAIIWLVLFTAPHAQNPVCRTALPGTKTNICASEAFVTQSNPWANVQASKSGAYPVVPTDCFSMIPLGGSAFYAVTITAPANYTPPPCYLIFVNEDMGAGKSMVISGMTTFILFPLTTVMIFQTSGVWRRFP